MFGTYPNIYKISFPKMKRPYEEYETIESLELENGKLTTTFPSIRFIYIDDSPDGTMGLSDNAIEAYTQYTSENSTSYLIRHIDKDSIMSRMNTSSTTRPKMVGPMEENATSEEEDDAWDVYLSDSYIEDLSLIGKKPHRVYIFSKRMIYTSLISKLVPTCLSAYLMDMHNEPLTGFQSIATIDLKTVEYARELFNATSKSTVIGNCRSLWIGKTDRINKESVLFEFYDELLVDYNSVDLTPNDDWKVDVTIEYISLIFDFMYHNMKHFEEQSESDQETDVRTTLNKSCRFEALSSCPFSLKEMEEKRNVLIRVACHGHSIVVSDRMVRKYLRRYINDGTENYDVLSTLYKQKFDMAAKILKWGCLPICLCGGPTTVGSMSNIGTWVDPNHKPLFPLNNTRVTPDQDGMNRVPWRIVFPQNFERENMMEQP